MNLGDPMALEPFKAGGRAEVTVPQRASKKGDPERGLV